MEGTSGYGRDGRGGEGGMHVRSQLRHELWRAATAPRLQYCLLLCAPRCCMHAISCEGNARIPRSVVMGRKRPSFAITVCFSVLRTVAVLHRCHVCVTPQPRPTCETLPTGLSLLEGEGWPSQAMRWVAPRRREAIVLGPVRCKDVWPPIATRSMQ